MDLSQFSIGSEFMCDGARWLCTDIGTRTVVAIRVDEATIGSKAADGSIATVIVSGADAAGMGWFDGPPYGVAERVFDEEDREVCEPALPKE